MPPIRIELSITLTTALCVGAGGSTGTIADKTITRDALGRPIIPGSQVKGKARWAAEQLLRGLGETIPAPFDADIERKTPIRAIFGSPQHPSPLRFADLIATATVQEARESLLTRLRPSVSIDRRRGTAADERLLMMETVRPGLTFTSERAIIGTLESEVEVALLWAALRLTTRWGGAKSRGLGWATLKPNIFWQDASEPMKDEQLARALRSLKLGRES